MSILDTELNSRVALARFLQLPPEQDQLQYEFGSLNQFPPEAEIASADKVLTYILRFKLDEKFKSISQEKSCFDDRTQPNESKVEWAATYLIWVK